METINFIGQILSFLGSVLLAAGLIRSKEAVIDEAAAYFDENPFKVRSELESRRFALWGFVLLIVGFAATAAVEWSRVAGLKSVYCVILICSGISVIGLLSLFLILRKKAKDHLSYKNMHHKKIFKDILNHEIGEIDRILESENQDSYRFTDIKSSRIDSLSRQMPGMDLRGQEIVERYVTKLKESKNFKQVRESLESCLTDLGD